MNEMPESLLAADEPAPVTVHNENGSSPFLIVADHAGNAMPRALGRLGVSETECAAAHRLGHRHRRRLPPRGGRARRDADPAELFAPRHRLQPHAGLGDVDAGDQRAHAGARQCGLERKRRRPRACARFFGPTTIGSRPSSTARRQAGRPTALIAMHSFTPVFKGVARPWHAGVLYNRDPRFAHLLMALLQARSRALWSATTSRTA